MSIKILGCLILVSLLGFIGASSSSVDVVNFTVHPYNESENNSFEGFVSNLGVDDKGEDFIVWVWENSMDSEFSYNLVFLDNILVTNGTEETFDTRGLNDDECYEISIIGIGEDGSEGPRVVDISCTLDKPKDIRRSHSNSNTKNDEIPNFFVSSGKGIGVENVVIRLENSSVEQPSYSWLVLFCYILGSLILVLLILIFLR